MNIAVSIGFSEILIKKMGIQFITIPNVVDVDFFSLVNDKVDKSNFKFLNIGHLNSNKNQIHLIESFLNKFKGDLSKKLTVAGYGSLRKKIDSFVNKNDSHNQINLLNAPSRSEVKDLIHQSDCLVVSSIIETFSVVVIESLSCGIPVVSVSSPGPCSILINENYGLLCGVNELGDSLNNIVERKDFYEKEKIRSYVVNTFSEKVISTKLQKVYASVCN